jgi:hypothetical protein
MRRINKLRGVNRYVAWMVIGLVVGFVLALVDHQFEPNQPIFILVVIGPIAGLTQAVYSERAWRKQQSSLPPARHTKKTLFGSSPLFGW